MDMDFKPLDVSQRTIIYDYLKNYDYVGSDYSYYAYLIWFDEIEYAEEDGAYYLRARFDGKLRYFVPLVKGGKTVREAIEALPYASELFACPKALAEELADIYDARSDRDYAEYIYLTEDFVAMKGKRYNKKRNHIHKFMAEYNYSIQKYRAEDLDELKAFEQSWLNERSFDSEDARDSAEREKEIMFAAVNASLTGETCCDVLRVDGKIAGFSVGERLPSNCAVIMYEKAEVAYDGIYSFLAHEFAKRNFLDCKYLNRQEDMGLEGLRRSKESYFPQFLLDKYYLTPRSLPDMSRRVDTLFDKLGVLRLQKEHFNPVMCFLKEGIASLDDKRNFLNYTDGELDFMLSNGYMLGALYGDKIIATCGVDADSKYGEELKRICDDSRDRKYFEFSGVMVQKEFRRQGISSALCKKVIEYARQNLKGATLCAVVQNGNIPSICNLEKLGFEKRGQKSAGIYDFVYLALDL